MTCALTFSAAALAILLQWQEVRFYPGLIVTPNGSWSWSERCGGFAPVATWAA